MRGIVIVSVTVTMEYSARPGLSTCGLHRRRRSGRGEGGRVRQAGSSIPCQFARAPYPDVSGRAIVTRRATAVDKFDCLLHKITLAIARRTQCETGAGHLCLAGRRRVFMAVQWAGLVIERWALHHRATPFPGPCTRLWPVPRIGLSTPKAAPLPQDGDLIQTTDPHYSSAAMIEYPGSIPVDRACSHPARPWPFFPAVRNPERASS